MISGAALEVAAWRLVAAGRRSVWALLAPSLAALGVAAVLVRRPAAGADAVASAAGGLAAGAGLYLATRLLVAAVRRWGTFARHAAGIYGRRDALSLPLALALAAVAVAGEELFWRGLFQARLAGAVDRGAAAWFTWVAFVGANLASANLAVIAGAAVGGGVWAWLAVRTGGMLASLICHATWTLLMVALPPLPRSPT